MGIHNLSKVLKEHCTDGVSEVTNDKMKGKVLALDTSNIIYQFMTAIKDMDDVAHVHGMIMKTTFLIKRGIKPVYIFDGKPPSIKQGTLDARQEMKDKIKTRLLEEDNDKLRKRTITISDKEIEECKEILRVMGIPYIEAPEEADAQCVYLVRKGICDGVGSEDMDMLTFGANKLYRNINSRGKIVEYDLETILDELELSRDQFIDMCILLGCDYCPTIEGIGMKRAYDLIKKHGMIEDIVALTSYVPSGEFMKRYSGARRYFKKAPVMDVKEGDIVWGRLDEERFTDLLINKYKYSKANVMKYISILTKGKATMYEEDMFSD